MTGTDVVGRRLATERGFGAALLLVLALSIGGGTANAAPPATIEGTWTLGNGQVLVQADRSSDGFIGTVVQPVTFAGCTHPIGQAIWRMAGAGTSYSGDHSWYSGACVPEPNGRSTWKITNTSATRYTLTFCTAHPGTGAPDPSATPMHPVGTTLCYALIRELSPAQTPSPPGGGGAAIVGTPQAGQKLTCPTGAWTNSPTAYKYVWSRNGTPIVGATTPYYTVVNGDQGTALTCSVTAFNGGGAGTPATSTAVKVAVPFVAHCPAATGALSGNTLGLVTLRMPRARARRAYSHSATRGRRYEDFFCLTPVGVRVGYASPLLTSTLTGKAKDALKGRVVWASTSSANYAVHGIRAGSTLAAAEKRLTLSRPFHVGHNTWYLASNGQSIAVFKVRHGIVGEIGIGLREILVGHAAQVAFLHSFY